MSHTLFRTREIVTREFAIRRCTHMEPASCGELDETQTWRDCDN